VQEAIRQITPEALRLYPPAAAAGFRRAAGEVHGLSADHVVATNGGDELLRLLITVYCPPQTGGIGITDPTYSLYPVLAAIQDTPVTVVPRTDAEDGGFALPDDYARRCNDAGCRLLFVVNPHAPSGRLEPLEVLRKLADEFRGILVVDEAYVDFATYHAIPLLAEDGRDNVVILRSLSKGYSLAGLRFGYGLAAPSIIASLDKARDSYNTDILAQAAATAALKDQDYARSTWHSVMGERARLTTALRQRGFTVPDSHSNFVLATVPRGLGHLGPNPAEVLYQALKQRDILIRYFSTLRLAQRLRITVGTAAQNDRLLDVLDQTLNATPA
jgi:histidinol-phosphate aminotransferase